MWPWGHLGVAYLLYSLYSRGRFRRPPRPEPTLAVVFGSQFADLVDKPLAWGLGPPRRSNARTLAAVRGRTDRYRLRRGVRLQPGRNGHHVRHRASVPPPGRPPAAALPRLSLRLRVPALADPHPPHVRVQRATVRTARGRRVDRDSIHRSARVLPVRRLAVRTGARSLVRRRLSGTSVRYGPVRPRSL